MFEDASSQREFRRRFLIRLGRFLVVAVLVDTIALVAGAIGFHFLEGLDWMDASLNASLVITGNGPVDRPVTPGGKLFVIMYSILGVILFAAVIGAFLTPVFQRVLHRLPNSRTKGQGKLSQFASEEDSRG